ncbi:cdc42 effector protein 3 [Anarrhichthys ocellatus]|uniref:cdc42 effector protein 3 n=1 Tax=Anarrhichthys ocellatus TaxID=433405 RepID=UPI0012EE3A87|nr:cdc42 effector protein 3-like [Anarrhichthys ocellatus]XP_031702894.1 cdc42 effector protein 3-like [Anarrhichthys ocellatus]
MPLRTSLQRKPSSGRWLSRGTKRREVLSVNMISLPLADFRHISHIGNDAHTDSFGDLSFLKMGHNLLLQSSQSEQNLFLACSPPPKPPRLNLDEAEGSEGPDRNTRHKNNTSQRRKKCSSMPLLDNEEKEAQMEKEDGYKSGNNVAPNLPRNLGRGSLNSDREEDSTETCHKTVRQHEEPDSGFSFSLDLGPSILDDVLQVMDKRQ